MNDTQRHSCRNSPSIDPEGDPGEDDHQHGGEVRLQHEEEDVPPQDEGYEETVVPAWQRETEKLQSFQQTVTLDDKVGVPVHPKGL